MAAEEAAEAAEAPSAEGSAGPREYRVVQGPVFKKVGTDPTSQKVIKLNKKVGSVLRSTGKTWQGPSGGDWAEQDPQGSEKPGWYLIEGPGFNQPGPLLEKVDDSEEPHMVVKLYSLITKDVLCEICMKPTETIRSLKWWVALRDPHKLKLNKVVIAREMPSEEQQGNFSISTFPTSNLHSNDSLKVGEAFKDGAEVPYFYMGEPSDDGSFDR
mmetsp:Transcript_20394/g.64244  ORF Transcript_20394/g.64244 Transcript_20394/m.64244 type:complete len:213 (+) Transcript_20394:55-693(+)